MLVQNSWGYGSAQVLYVLIVVVLDISFVLLARVLYGLAHKLLRGRSEVLEVKE